VFGGSAIDVPTNARPAARNARLNCMSLDFLCLSVVRICEMGLLMFERWFLSFDEEGEFQVLKSEKFAPLYSATHSPCF
jgi:hypothetical protein